MNKTFLSLSMFLVLAATTVQAQFTYITNNGAITITGYNGPGGAVTIPATINGLSVTSIGDGAFFECYSLTSVLIPNSVTSIEKNAFVACNSLMSVTIPDSVTSIGDEAFEDCQSLTNAAIGNSVTNIGDGAFNRDYGLISITIPASVTSIGDEAFGSPSLTIVFFQGNAPNSSPLAFSYSLGGYGGPIFPSDPAAIYYLAGATGWSNTFAGLPTVMLTAPPQFGATDDGLEYLSDDTKIIITKYVDSDDTIIIPEAIHGLPVIVIGPYAFQNSLLTNVTIPESVTTIGDGAFVQCFSLSSVTIGNGVTSIGKNAFHAAPLTNLTIPDGVTTIGSGAFEECYSLTSVTIGNGVISLRDYAFGWCDNLKSVTIGNGVTSIGDGTFEGCANLTKIYFSGNAPAADSTVFDADDSATVYFLPGTLGWTNTFAGVPTALWFMPQPLILNQGPGFGAQSNQFGFTISWATNVSVVVEAASNLSNPLWLPVSTNTLVGGASYFSDPQPANLPVRFYRLRSQ